MAETEEETKTETKQEWGFCGSDCTCNRLQMDILFGDEVNYPTCAADEECEACQ